VSSIVNDKQRLQEIQIQQVNILPTNNNMGSSQDDDGNDDDDGDDGDNYWTFFKENGALLQSSGGGGEGGGIPLSLTLSQRLILKIASSPSPRKSPSLRKSPSQHANANDDDDDSILLGPVGDLQDDSGDVDVDIEPPPEIQRDEANHKQSCPPSLHSRNH
jgi:hypothetical protein